MDAAEADFDAKLYKASGDIIPELQVKLPQLVWHDQSGKRVRTHVLYSKCEELMQLLDRFQEWPQLLDPVLAPMVQTIVDGFLAYITSCPQTYGHQADLSEEEVAPLPMALGRLLYTFCKVRGYKIIVRLLNNEPRYVEPMLSAVRRWETYRSQNSGMAAVWEAFRTQSSGLATVWEEKYITLLWLSHLMLAPFELSTLSTTNKITLSPDLQHLSHDLPEVAVDVLSLGFQNISSPSKERESAVILLVRLALRRDMQAVGLAGRLVDHAVGMLVEAPSQRTTSVYPAIGHLSLLYALMNLGTDTEVAPFLKRVFEACSVLTTSPDEYHASIRGSAPARKLLVKVTRVCLTHAIALTDTVPDLDGDSVNAMLEEGIQNYLDALGDKDSPVRMAASKALSIVALKLNNNMAAEIVEAVLGGLSENILVEDPVRNRLIAKTERPDEETASMRRNVSAVDPLKWHGLMLTLGHLLFRRSPPSYLLADIIETLLLGLEFEQRSNVGTSIGNGVRDAACFGIWSLSRKYATKELEPIKIQHVAGMGQGTIDTSQSVLQLIAVRLMLSACFDPSGNIRRGSAAALQELIGRHPDTIIQGIPVVQVVDYQAVARRSRAMVQVAVEAAALDPVYHEALLQALLDWRGARAADADSRRWASTAMRKLNTSTTSSRKDSLLKDMAREVQALKPRNLGTTAGARHGILLSMASVIQSIPESASSEHQKIRATLEALHLSAVTGNLQGRTTTDMELVIEAIGALFGALAVSLLTGAGSVEVQTSATVREMLGIINHCILVCNRTVSVDACAVAVAALFGNLDGEGQKALLDVWLQTASQKRSELVCKGRLTALAHIHSLADSVPEEQEGIVSFLVEVITGSDAIETRTFAMDSLSLLIRRCGAQQFGALNFVKLGTALSAGLNDYTNDQRGDIGSILRLASLDAVEVLCRGPLHAARPDMLQQLLPSIVRLAAEKLNKVRHRAWNCLKLYWQTLDQQPPLEATFTHLADVSSEEYFRALMPLLNYSPVHQQLVMGLSSSAAGTTEEIGRACCAALVHFQRQHSEEQRKSVSRGLVLSLLANLNQESVKDDHQIIPMIELLTFLLQQDSTSLDWLQPGDDETMWNTAQKVHVSTTSMERAEALIKLYFAFLSLPALRTKTLDKLTRQLLHRFPKVRNAAADTLYLDSGDVQLVEADWNAAAATNKPVVLNLRRTLGVAKAAVAQKSAS